MYVGVFHNNYNNNNNILSNQNGLRTFLDFGGRTPQQLNFIAITYISTIHSNNRWTMVKLTSP